MCGSKNTSTTATTSPNPQALQAYSSLLGQAGNVAQTPFTPYTGEFTAPVNAQQQTGIGGINANANYAMPDIGQATNFATQAASPITASQIAQYQNPYTQQVVNATQAQFNNQNQQQQAQLIGNAGAQGALGGDRVGVAQANLAGQQQTAQAPVIAGLESQGYTTGLSTALAEQQNLGNAAYSLGNLGVAGQNAALTGANAQVGAGTLEQSTQQQQDTALYNQFLAQQAYPFQTTQWLAGLDTGVGSQMGGTSQTTPPAPNYLNTALGLGVAGLAAFANRGGRIPPHRDAGGGIGAMPYAGVQGYVPTMAITRGQGAPKAPGVPAAPASNFNSYTQAGKGIGNLLDPSGNPGNPLDLNNGFTSGEALGSMQDIGTAPAVGGLGALYAKGGGVDLGHKPIMVRRGFDDGGTVGVLGAGSIVPSFDDRFGVPPAAPPAPIYNALQNYGSTQTDAINGAGTWTDQMPPDPLPRARPATASNVDTGETSLDLGGLPAAITRGTDAPTDLGGTPSALSYSPGANIGTAGVPNAAPATPADAPAHNGIGGLLGLNLSPAARAGLLSAGLGMMASRSPYLGQAIGEGGLQGVAAYSGEQKQELATKKTQADIDHGKQQLAQAAKAESDRIALETKRAQQTQDYQGQEIKLHQSQLDEAKRQHDMSLKTPIKYGETQSGVPLMALPRLDDKGNIQYFPIARDGSVATAPLGQTPSNAPALSPGPSAAPGPQSALPASATRVAALDTGTVTDAPPVEIRAQAPPASPGARDEQYLAKISQEDPRYAAEIRGIANYQINPSGIASLRGNRRENLMRDILTYDPTYDQRRYAQTNRAISGWAQSVEGRSTRSLSVAVDHLGTAQDLGLALQNGNVQAINGVKNWAKTQLGYEGPVDFNFAKQIVADEMAKAVIGGNMTEGDRHGLQASLSAASSPDQLVGVVRTAKQLMAGQLNGLRSTYEQATGLHNFDTWLTPRARQEIEAAQQHAPAAPGQGATAAAPTHSPQDQQALDWANKNPTDPRAAAIKKRLGAQ